MTRVILDAHISGPVVKREGRDVFSVDQNPELEGLPDQDLLSLAANDNRVLVTANVRHFLALLTEMNAAGESHAGCILVPKSVSNEDFGVLISGIERVLEVHRTRRGGDVFRGLLDAKVEPRRCGARDTSTRRGKIDEAQDFAPLRGDSDSSYALRGCRIIGGKTASERGSKATRVLMKRAGLSRTANAAPEVTWKEPRRK